jgi:hydrogenase maturation protein HypF
LSPKSLLIEVRGVVQGVGFRPFVTRIAKKYSLCGFVQNSFFGALIAVEGDTENIEKFCLELQHSTPPLAKIDDIKITLQSTAFFKDFVVKESTEDGKKISFFPPDLSICADCEKELFDKNDRRFLYPLINCQNCGPRFTLIKALPYDRERTTMDVFEMCDKCKDEYGDINDRRFHAEPVSCEVCGPKFYFTDANGAVLQKSKNADVLECVADALRENYIIALKGVGGFHLLCRADNDEAVLRLRNKKRRAKKPLAVMFKNIEELGKECEASAFEKSVVCGAERAITILKKSKNCSLSPYISHESAYLGAFLPYSGIYAILMDKVEFPLVTTSANISDEPIIYEESELFKKLESCFDYACYYDRQIVHGCDDSVVRSSGEEIIKLRNSRGYAPVFTKTDFYFEKNVFCAGAHQKNTFSICFENNILNSSHIGDLGSLDAVASYEKSIEHFQKMYGFEFGLAVCDKNKRYASSKFAKSLGVKTLEIQHHKAHFLASLFEKNALDIDALGVVWDGTGLGDDGKVWGAEFFVKSGYEIDRALHLESFWVLGGEKSAKEPYKSAFSMLLSFGKQDAADRFGKQIGLANDETKLLFEAFDKKINCYESNSMGRLFDAVAALAGVVAKDSYDGESGLMLESLYDENDGSYFDVFDGVNLNISVLLDEILKQNSPKEVATKFINTLSKWVVAVSGEHDLPIFCSGGVFQNAALVGALKKELKTFKNRPIFHSKFAPNDSSISFGQAAFAKLYLSGKIKETFSD